MDEIMDSSDSTLSPLSVKEENSPQKVVNHTSDIASNIKAEYQVKDEPFSGRYSDQNGFNTQSSSVEFETPLLNPVKNCYPVIEIKPELKMDLQTKFKEENLAQDVMNIPLQIGTGVKEEVNIKNNMEMLDFTANLEQEMTNLNSRAHLSTEINKSETLLVGIGKLPAPLEVPQQQESLEQTKEKSAHLECHECYVKLERLPPSYIKVLTGFSDEGKTLLKDCTEKNMPKLPAVLPEGLSVILTENGVWSAGFLAKGTVFGPYDPPPSSSDRISGYWASNMKMKQRGQKHNMVAEIVEKYLYYRIVTNIQPETELICKIKHKLVIGKPGRSGEYFKCQYCKKLFDRRCSLKIHLRIHTGEKPYKCHKCGRCFSQVSSRNIHIMFVHGVHSKKYKCKQCGKHFHRKSSLENHVVTHIGQKVYKCPECGKQLAHKCGLKRHLFTHNSQKLYQCLECPKKCTSKIYLARHIRSHSDLRPYPCEQCNKAFKYKEHLESHLNTHAVDKKYKCSICDKQFAVSRNLKCHMLVHNKEKPYQCDVCGKQFKEKQSVKRHRRLHTGERPYKCTQCDKAYTTASNLSTHEKSHILKYECATCQAQFGTKRELKLHVSTHTGKKSYKCDKCSKGFLQRISLDKHMAIHSESGEKKHSCPKCDKSYFSEEYLQAHMKIHGRHDETPKCKECGKIFSSFNCVRLHMVTHLEKKPHQCEKCGQYFSQKYQLMGHLAKHSGEKPHKCEICGNDFFTAYSLHTHMIIHTDKKNKCDMCNKTFFRKSDLIYHMRTHTGERPHECVQCGKRFSKITYLKNHLLVHSGEKPHKCHVCGRCFAAKSNLNTHVKKHRKH